MDVDVSVIICTYNRCEMLVNSIKSILGQSFSPERFELIIIDNNSTDFTRQVVEKIATDSPVRIRYFFESRQGLSFARNTGIEHADGKIVVFTDDDIEADKDWLQEITSVFDSPDVACAGGPLRPIWLAEKPSWLTDNMMRYLAVSDFKEVGESCEFNAPHFPWGANIAFRKEIIEELGGFSVSLGRSGQKLLSNEEIELCHKIINRGKNIKLVPGAIVHHKIAGQRLKKIWFYHRYFQQGWSDVILDLSLRKELSQLQLLSSSGIWSYSNSDSSNIEVRCSRKQILGYLNGLLLSSCGSRRRIRQFETYINEQIRGLREKIGLINSLEEQVRYGSALIEEKDQQLAERDQQLTDRQRHIEECIEHIRQRDAEIEHRGRQIVAMQNSISWRLTSPIRWLFDKINKISGGN